MRLRDREGFYFLEFWIGTRVPNEDRSPDLPRLQEEPTSGKFKYVKKLGDSGKQRVSHGPTRPVEQKEPRPIEQKDIRNESIF